MGVAVTLIVFTVGALLRFATTADSSSPSLNIHVIGVVIMIFGAVGLVVSVWELTLGHRPARIERKTFAHLHEWLQKRNLTPSWPTRNARAWSNQTTDWEGKQRHHDSMYVFALPAHQEADAPDATDISQWRFFVVPSRKIDRRDRMTISEPMLTSIAKEVRYTELSEAVRRAAEPEKEAAAAPGR